SHHDWNSVAGRMEIDHLSRGFARLGNVAEVRSLTQPLGKPLPGPAPEPGTPGLLDQLLHAMPSNFLNTFVEEARRVALKHYVAKVPSPEPGRTPLYVTRLDVVLNSDPFDPASVETMRLVQTWLHTEMPRSPFVGKVAAAEVFGVMVNTSD